jgi:hypothetical protein
MRWLAEGESLFNFRDELVHSTGGYQVRGDGTARFVRERPRESGTHLQRTAEELDEIVDRLTDGTSDGHLLWMDATALVEHGLTAYDDRVRQRKNLEDERERLFEQALREAHGAASEEDR